MGGRYGEIPRRQRPVAHPQEGRLEITWRVERDAVKSATSLQPTGSFAYMHANTARPCVSSSGVSYQHKLDHISVTQGSRVSVTEVSPESAPIQAGLSCRP